MKEARSVTGYSRRRYELNGNTLSDDGRFVIIPRTHPWEGKTDGWLVPVETFDAAADGWDEEKHGSLPCATDAGPRPVPAPARRVA